MGIVYKSGNVIVDKGYKYSLEEKVYDRRSIKNVELITELFENSKMCCIIKGGIVTYLTKEDDTNIIYRVVYKKDEYEDKKQIEKIVKNIIKTKLK